MERDLRTGKKIYKIVLHTNQKIIPNGFANIIENDMV